MSRWDELRRMWQERRVGFRMEERMAGTHTYRRDFPPGEVRAGAELPLAFRASWGHERLGAFLRPGHAEFLQAQLGGTITAGGLCVEAPLAGELELRYLEDATIRYRFEFAAHGQRFRYEGQKRGLRPWNLHRTHTLCYGAITALATGEVLSESTVRFDLLELPALLWSWRLR